MAGSVKYGELLEELGLSSSKGLYFVELEVRIFAIMSLSFILF